MLDSNRWTRPGSSPVRAIGKIDYLRSDTGWRERKKRPQPEGPRGLKLHVNFSWMSQKESFNTFFSVWIVGGRRGEGKEVTGVVREETRARLCVIGF
jgi:hypothetical protein